jgi:hypothetical protein
MIFHLFSSVSGLSSVNMQMTLPKTDITVRTGGTHLELQLPETFMSMLAGKWGETAIPYWLFFFFPYIPYHSQI